MAIKHLLQALLNHLTELEIRRNPDQKQPPPPTADQIRVLNDLILDVRTDTINAQKELL